jgi:hypothetical protein
MPRLAGTPDVNKNRDAINLRDALNSRNPNKSWDSRNVNGSKNIGNIRVTSRSRGNRN